jgi:hypothetical protein
MQYVSRIKDGSLDQGVDDSDGLAHPIEEVLILELLHGIFEHIPGNLNVVVGPKLLEDLIVVVSQHLPLLLEQSFESGGEQLPLPSGL